MEELSTPKKQITIGKFSNQVNVNIEGNLQARNFRNIGDETQPVYFDEYGNPVATEAKLVPATEKTDGFMTKEDKEKLDGITPANLLSSEEKDKLNELFPSYWAGTKAEFEAKKDSIHDGTIVKLTDDNYDGVNNIVPIIYGEDGIPVYLDRETGKWVNFKRASEEKVTGDAKPEDVLASKVFSSVGNSNVTGTMPKIGAWEYTPFGYSNIFIPKGYHDGNGYINLLGLLQKTEIKLTFNKEALNNSASELFTGFSSIFNNLNGNIVIKFNEDGTPYIEDNLSLNSEVRNVSTVEDATFDKYSYQMKGINPSVELNIK